MKLKGCESGSNHLLPLFLLKCLRRDVIAAERKVEALVELRREEQVRGEDGFINARHWTWPPHCEFHSVCACCSTQERTQSAVNLSKSVEVTRAHLQGQLRNKEAESNRLTVQLRVLYQTVEST